LTNEAIRPFKHFLLLMRSGLAGFLILLASPAAWAVDPSPHVSQYGQQAWKVRDGLLPSEVMAIARTVDSASAWVGMEFSGAGLRLQQLKHLGRQEPGTGHQAFYIDLGPGKYRFHVIACNNDGVWNEEGASLNFVITPAWYQTTWFRVLFVAIAPLAVWVVFRLRVRQIVRTMNLRFDERLAERTRIARDLHDTLLQTIQGSKLVADDALDPSTDSDRVRRAVEQLSVWLARATQESRAALNSLHMSTLERNDLAAAFRRAIDECRLQNSMASSFSLVGEPQEMHPIVRDEVYRIGYEAIRNACLHSHAGQLWVELTYSTDLTLRIRDDGVGMDAELAGSGREGHFGLRGMRERAARIAGDLEIESSAAGTRVELIVPGGLIYSNATARRKNLRATVRALLRKLGLSHDPKES
jgi:signal transduction histidine kinase